LASFWALLSSCMEKWTFSSSCLSTLLDIAVLFRCICICICWCCRCGGITTGGPITDRGEEEEEEAEAEEVEAVAVADDRVGCKGDWNQFPANGG